MSKLALLPSELDPRTTEWTAIKNRLGTFAAWHGSDGFMASWENETEEGERLVLPLQDFLEKFNDVRTIEPPVIVRTIAGTADRGVADFWSNGLGRTFDELSHENPAGTQLIGATAASVLWSVCEKRYDFEPRFRIDIAVCETDFNELVPSLLVIFDDGGTRIGMKFDLSWDGIPTNFEPEILGDEALDFKTIDERKLAKPLGLNPSECREMACNPEGMRSMPYWDEFGDEFKEKVAKTIVALRKELDMEVPQDLYQSL